MTGLASPDPHARAAAAATAGLGPSLPRAVAGRLEAMAASDTDDRVRVAALGALTRAASPTRAARGWQRARRDPSPAVRRRAAELAPKVPGIALGPLLLLLDDDDGSVAETAAWAIGEIAWSSANRARAVGALARTTAAADPLLREAAVAALGALGDERGLPAILAGCRDRPAVRRRAVLALAPFDGPEVDDALRAASTDADWQVRQAAEDLRS